MSDQWNGTPQASGAPTGGDSWTNSSVATAPNDEQDDIAQLLGEDQPSSNEGAGESDSVVPDVAEEVIAYEDEVEPTAYANSGEFSWQQVAQILNFVNRLQSFDQSKRAAFDTIFGVQGHALDIANSLYYSPNSRVGTLQFLFKVADVPKRSAAGEYMYAAEIAAELSTYESVYIREIVRTANSLAESYTPVGGEAYVIRYRKNMEAPTVMKMLIDSVTSIQEDALVQIGEFQELIALWPGNLV